MSGRKQRNNSNKLYPSVALYNTNFTWTALGLNPGLADINAQLTASAMAKSSVIFLV
jgi:hypothetical protein